MDTPPATVPATDDSVLLKPKTKREKTEKQKAVWDKACETRINNAKLKKEALAKAKEEIENKKNKKYTEDLAVIDKPTKSKPKVVYESDSEPEVIVVKKKKKPVVYQEESSEDEAPPPPPKKAKVPVVVAPAPKTPIIRFF
jgi:hypothetical protein